MELALRLETEKDYRIVEELTREAFWNIHVPGCDEHLLVRNMRNSEDFIGELDFVATQGDKIVGSIMYARSKIIGGDLEHAVLTFGPISALPEFQNKGIGGKLIRHTIKLAKEMSYKAIVIYGDPEYYKRFGFRESKLHKITNKEKKYPAALLVLELFPNALDGIEGVFDEGKAYETDKNELEEFEKLFPKKEKGYSKTQDRFNGLCGMYL